MPAKEMAKKQSGGTVVRCTNEVWQNQKGCPHALRVAARRGVFQERGHVKCTERSRKSEQESGHCIWPCGVNRWPWQEQFQKSSEDQNPIRKGGGEKKKVGTVNMDSFQEVCTWSGARLWGIARWECWALGEGCFWFFKMEDFRAC